LYRVLLLPLCLLVVLLATACGSSDGDDNAAPSVPDGAAAVVGDISIPKGRLDNLMKQAEIVYKRTNRPFPEAGTRAYTQLRARATAYLVVSAMYLGHAAEDDIAPSDDEIAAEVTRVKTTYGKTAAAQEKQMKAQAMTDEELREQARLKLVQKGVERKVFDDVKVTDADVKAFYEKNRDRFTVPETRVVRQILVHNAKLARELRDRARGGSDFAALARRYSEDKPSAREGGKVAITKDQTVKAFDEAAFSLPTGKISDVIVTQYGWQIVQPISPITPAQVTKLSEVAAQIRRQLLQDKRERALGKWQLDAKHEFCKGEIAYDPDYKPLAEDNPCRPSSPALDAANG
jgi:parvulin-like peptidyl-prolyl isomerase